MIQNLSAAAGERVSVSFTPTLAPMSRGILATCSAKAVPGCEEGALRAVYEKAYQDEQFVTLLPEGVWPATASVTGSNTVQIQVALDTDAGRLIVISALDNLTKGTAGGAVQSMNIALGLPEDLGLPAVGLAP
jgi:N-acetyl-gamma-glutamyl-phosphate reductase